MAGRPLNRTGYFDPLTNYEYKLYMQLRGGNRHLSGYLFLPRQP
jgi:hypothetical protein